MTDIAFIDLEATGLSARSWPIEVGWCGLAGAPEAMFIRPAEQWPVDAWDPEAEALHGIALETLVSDGVAASEVCERLNTALGDKVVYSDAPDWDGFWLYRLFQAARMRQQFVLSDFYDLFVGVDRQTIERLIADADKTAPRLHRASADVLHMLTLYALAAQGD